VYAAAKKQTATRNSSLGRRSSVVVRTARLASTCTFLGQL